MGVRKFRRSNGVRLAYQFEAGKRETRVRVAFRRAPQETRVRVAFLRWRLRGNPGQSGLSEVATTVLEAKLPPAARAGDF